MTGLTGLTGMTGDQLMTKAKGVGRAWFDSPEKLVLLEFKAVKWVGTPFFPNSNTPGPRGGVSCQKLVAALYAEVGFCQVEAPDVAMSHARYNQTSLIEPFMDGRREFQRLYWLQKLLPGDMLGFRIGEAIHHSGILLAQGIFIHASRPGGVGISYLTDATWGARLAGAWRPVYYGGVTGLTGLTGLTE